MGFLRLFSFKPPPTLMRLPQGSFSVDPNGALLATTLPSSFPEELATTISEAVLLAFREASQAQIPLSTLTINYPSLKITARELRGGAMIFLSPKAAPPTNNQP